MFTLAGRSALIAGGTGAQGRGVVRALCEGGMNVAMVTHNPEDAAQLIRDLSALPGKCIAISNENGDGAAARVAAETFGSLDVVIPNQGGGEHYQPIEEITEDMLVGKFRHQLIGSWDMVTGALPYLKKSKAGRIILISTEGALNGQPENGICANVARGAVIALARSLARELAKDRITVNCIVKGALVNDHPPRAGEYNAEDLLPSIPLERLGTAEDFGAAAAWLASEEAGFVTGQLIRLTGGRSL